MFSLFLLVVVFGSGDSAGYGKSRLSLQQSGGGGCLKLFLVSLLTGRQSFGHNMYGFNSSCSSAGVFAVGRWVTFVAGAFYKFG